MAEWLDLPHGIPAHDTFGRVFARLDPAQVEAGFLRWVQQVAQTAAPEVIALDGKTVRRSGDRRTGLPALHLLSAWATTQRLVLAQEAVATKANEITTLPALLDRLDLTGQIVTIDAMGCQREIAAQIMDGGGDYVLALKANQPELLADVIDSFTVAAGPDAAQRTVEKNHGRLEWRACETISDPAVIAWLDPDRRWPGLRTIARVTATRQVTGQEADHGGPVLPQQPARNSQTDRRGRAQSLGDRELRCICLTLDSCTRQGWNRGTSPAGMPMGTAPSTSRVEQAELVDPRWSMMRRSRSGMRCLPWEEDDTRYCSLRWQLPGRTAPTASRQVSPPWFALPEMVL